MAGSRLPISGTIPPAGPRSNSSNNPDIAVSSGLISIRYAPASLATCARSAAGCTTLEVPTEKKTSARSAASPANCRVRCGKGSPNQTTPGRIMPPHSQYGNSPPLPNPTSPLNCRHRWQTDTVIFPCNSRGWVDPARRWRPSTFCVIKVKSGKCRSQRANSTCAGFGCASATRRRRCSYHSQTVRGSRANASGVARSSGRYDFHHPPAERNVGIPLSAETPAPVRTTTRTRSAVSASISRSEIVIGDITAKIRNRQLFPKQQLGNEPHETLLRPAHPHRCQSRSRPSFHAKAGIRCSRPRHYWTSPVMETILR